MSTRPPLPSSNRPPERSAGRRGRAPAAAAAVAVLVAFLIGAAATTVGAGPAGAGAPVLPAISTTTLTSSLNPSVLGDSVSFLAAVTGPTGPVTTGTVDILVDGVVLADDVALDAGGYVGVSTSGLDIGDRTIVASYSGSPMAFSASDDSLVQAVEAPPAVEAPTAIELTSSVNPALPGEDVSFTAAVTSDGAPVLVGTVDITVDGAVFVTDAAVGAGGLVGFTTSFAAVGTYPVVVTYDANPAFAASSAGLDQVVAAPVDPDPDPTAPDATTSTSTPTTTSTTATPGAAVEATTTSVPPVAAPAAVAARTSSGGTLPRTGPGNAAAALVGLGLVVAGSMVVVAVRRRSAA